MAKCFCLLLPNAHRKPQNCCFPFFFSSLSFSPPREGSTSAPHEAPSAAPRADSLLHNRSREHAPEVTKAGPNNRALGTWCI